MNSKLLLSAAALALLASPAFAAPGTTPASSPTPGPAAAADAPMAAPAPTMDAPAPAPTAAPAPAMDAPTAPAPADAGMAAPAPADPTAAMPMTEDTTPAAPAPEAAAPPAEEPAKPAPVKKKKAPPAKLSELSKKYDLMSLDTNGDKSLSKEEFTAKGFASDKTFARFDMDHNGKLTNSEINAYASNIEAQQQEIIDIF